MRLRYKISTKAIKSKGWPEAHNVKVTLMRIQIIRAPAFIQQASGHPVENVISTLFLQRLY